MSGFRFERKAHQNSQNSSRSTAKVLYRFAEPRLSLVVRHTVTSATTWNSGTFDDFEGFALFSFKNKREDK